MEFATSKGVFVPAHLFTPPPKVDSLVLHLERLPSSQVEDAKKKAFMRLVKAGFSAKRKTLRNTISSGEHISKQQAEAMLQAAQIMPERRAQTLSIDDWKRLYDSAVDMLIVNE